MVVSEIPGIFDGPGIKWDDVLEPAGAIVLTRGESSTAASGAKGGVGSIMVAQNAALMLQARFRGERGRRRSRGVRKLGDIANAVDFDGKIGPGASCGAGGSTGGGAGGSGRRCAALSRLLRCRKKRTIPADAAAGDNGLVGLVYRESSDDEEYEVAALASHTENSFLVRRRGSASGAVRKNCVSRKYLQRKQLEAGSTGPAMRGTAVSPLRARAQ